MDKKDVAKEWFNIALNDLKAAEFLKKMQPPPIEIICYHCQQSVEKYLKGYLVAQGENLIKTHDLILLNKLCRKYDESFKNIEEECLMLTDFSVNVRYLYALDLTERDMEIALKKLLKLKKFISKKI